jgi:two-component system sensor histidine kinase SenX3
VNSFYSLGVLQLLPVGLSAVGAMAAVLPLSVPNHSGDVPDGIDPVLAALPGAAIVPDVRGRVLRSSSAAAGLGVIRSGVIVSSELIRILAEVSRDSVVRELEFQTRRPPLGKGRLELKARVGRLNDKALLVLIEDLSESRRVDTVRRDFVANVSHELKTPVGALSLLAEAVQAASDDPEAIKHFAGRMQVEAARLTNLVTDLIDLSRLQGDEPLAHAEPVHVDHVVAEAVDATRLSAAAKEIEVFTGGRDGLIVLGVDDQLVMALRNLLANAVSYSPPRTRIGVATRQTEAVVEISVTDQGIGIPPPELERIFERFYRVDPARSRMTGGTGLGLSLVKHICRNHGGDVTVWSVEGEGSTFTLRLPTLLAAHELLVPDEVAQEEALS